MTVVGIYGLRHKTNNKWYVGQSTDVHHRWHHAYELGHCKAQRKIHAALKKYGYDAFEKVLIETCDAVDWILDYREMYWIREYDCLNSGYNIREGGSHGKMSTASRAKMSASGKGKKKPKRTAEQRENMRNAQLGKKQSEETKRKRSASMRGKVMPPRSEEHRRRISEAAKERFKDSTKHPLFGRKYTEEDRQKMRDALLKYNQNKAKPI